MMTICLSFDPSQVVPLVKSLSGLCEVNFGGGEEIYLHSLRLNVLLDFLICGLKRNITSSAFLFDHTRNSHLSLCFSRAF
jgi:hypothetical protein